MTEHSEVSTVDNGRIELDPDSDRVRRGPILSHPVQTCYDSRRICREICCVESECIYGIGRPASEWNVTEKNLLTKRQLISPGGHLSQNIGLGCGILISSWIGEVGYFLVVQ